MRDEHRRAADMPESLEATVIRGVGLPAGDTGDIEMAVLGVETALLRARQEIRGDPLRCPLPLSADLLARDHQRGAGAEGEVDQVPGPAEGRPGGVPEEDLPGAGIILPTRKVEQRRLRGLPALRTAVTEMRALVLAQFDLHDRGGRGPVAFLQARGEEPVVRREAGAVRIAQPGRQHLDALAPAQPQHALVARGRVEATLGIGLEADDVIVAALGRRIPVRHALVEVRLVVAVQVMQTRHLIATEHVHPAPDDLDAQRLVQPRGETLPAHLTQFRVETAHEPDLARHRADRRGAIRQEVEPGEEHQRAIGIGEGHGDRVRGERLALSDRTLRLDPGRPLRRAALGQVRELRGLLRSVPRRGEELATADGITEDRLRPMAVETMVDAVRGRHAGGAAPHDLTEETPAVVEAVAHLAQPHEPALPLQRKGQRRRIEASAAVAFMDADRLRDRQPLAAEDAGEQRPFICLLPAPVAPGHLVVLITLMAVESAIQTWILRQQRRRGAAKSRRLLRVEIVDAVAIDESLPETCLLGMQRRLGRAELRRDRSGRERLLKRP